MRRMYSKPQLLEAVESESKLNGIKVFEDIKDKDGHARFIEGAITTPTLSGFTFEYAKWSLSGSHLMIVLAGKIASGTSLTINNFGTITLPTWINGKIKSIFGIVVDVKNVGAYAEDYSAQNMTIRLQKSGDNDIVLRNVTTTGALSADRMFRIDFDLLIDNE